MLGRRICQLLGWPSSYNVQSRGTVILLRRIDAPTSIVYLSWDETTTAYSTRDYLRCDTFDYCCGAYTTKYSIYGGNETARHTLRRYVPSRSFSVVRKVDSSPCLKCSTSCRVAWTSSACACLAQYANKNYSIGMPELVFAAAYSRECFTVVDGNTIYSSQYQRIKGAQRQQKA